MLIGAGEPLAGGGAFWGAAWRYFGGSFAWARGQAGYRKKTKGKAGEGSGLERQWELLRESKLKKTEHFLEREARKKKSVLLSSGRSCWRQSFSGMLFFSFSAHSWVMFVD